MNYSKFLKETLRKTTLNRFDTFGMSGNVITNQEEFDNACSAGILIGDYYIRPDENDEVDISKTVFVSGNLILGGQGKIFYPQTPLFISGNLLIFGYGDINLNLFPAVESIVIFNHIGDIGLNILPNNEINSIANLSIGLMDARTKITINGLDKVTRNLDIMYNKGDIMLPNLIEAKNLLVHNNWAPLSLPIKNADLVDVSQNESSISLNKLESIKDSANINSNIMPDKNKYYPRGAYVNMSKLVTCGSINCTNNDCVNLSNLTTYSHKYLEKNSKLYTKNGIEFEKTL